MSLALVLTGSVFNYARFQHTMGLSKISSKRKPLPWDEDEVTAKEIHGGWSVLKLSYGQFRRKK